MPTDTMILTYTNTNVYTISDTDPLLVKDLDRITRCVHHYTADSKMKIEDEGLDGYIPIDPELIQAIARQHNITDDDIMVIGELAGGKYLARTFTKESQSHVLFLVFSKDGGGQVLFSFKWSLTFYWGNFGMGLAGGCMVDENVEFYCAFSNMGNYVIIIGPAECDINGSDQVPFSRIAYPSIKILDVQHLKVEVSILIPYQLNIVVTVNLLLI